MLSRGLELAVGLLVLLGSTPVAHPGDEPRDPAGIYDRTCHFCHDTGIGPPLKGSHYPAERIRTAVRHGHAAMVAFTPTEITDPELTALAQMLNESSPPGAAR
ncbi:MAG: c-type cytochrome [Steroidobacterales bacterium]